MLNYRTATGTTSQEPLTLADIKEAMDKLAAIPKNDKWIVVDPSGKMYEGTIQQITHLVVQHHPMFTSPVKFPYVNT